MRRGDLLVVGGGPAGLATALFAARAGLRVVVREARTGPVDKACGEGLMPGALRTLRELGVDPEGHDLTGIRYAADRAGAGHIVAEAGFRHGVGRGVRRTTLAAALRAACERAGVVVEERAVRDVHLREREVVADGSAFRHVVAADGLHSPLRHRAGLDGPSRRLRRWGLRRHFEVEPWTSFVEVHWSPGGEAYVTPVGPRLVGVALLGDRGRSFDERLGEFPTLARRLSGASAGAVRGAGPLLQGSRGRTAGRLLLVGDAAGYVDALTGEGIALAVAEARVAVAAVVAGDPQAYERDWRRVTRRYRFLTAGLLLATQVPAVRTSLVPTARRLPRLFEACVDAVATAA